MIYFNKNFLLSTVMSGVVLTVCGTAELRAQTINDDLKPAKPVNTKTSKTPRPKNNKSGNPQKKVEAAVPRPMIKTSVNNSSPATPQPQPQPQPQAPPSRPLEPPSEIIARYMDFQKSSGVTGADWESVIKQSNAALQSNTNDKMAKTQLAVAQGQIAFNKGDYSTALVQFNAAAQLMPESALPFYNIGNVYLSTKQPNEAQKAFEKAIKINRNLALAYKGLGDVQTALGKTKKAQEYYKRAAQIGITGNNSPSGGTANQSTAPNSTANPATPVPSTETPYERDLNAARKLTAQKKWNQSLTNLQTLAVTNPTTDVYILIGDNYFGMKAWLSAQQAYRKAVEINPNSALAFYKSGTVLFETNEYQAAAEAFEKSLILDQNGMAINRPWARKMADKAAEKARESSKDKKKRFIF